MYLGAAENHFAECMAIADEGRKKNQGVHLGVVYDELCRRQWAESSLKRLEGFDVNAKASRRDEDQKYAHAYSGT